MFINWLLTLHISMTLTLLVYIHFEFLHKLFISIKEQNAHQFNACPFLNSYYFLFLIYNFKIIKQILILNKDDQCKYKMQFLKHDFIC